MLIKASAVPMLVVASAICAALLAYWTGLSGPFLLDDPANLSSIPAWLDGRLGLSTLIFERGGGSFGRPLSMASFAFNAWIGGYTPYSLKLGNLLIHLTCGVASYLLLARLFQKDPGLARNPRFAAAIVAALWLLHPLHASTVLYAVQRMAQLSGLAILLGLLAYVHARDRLDKGSGKVATVTLFIGIPAMTVMGFFAKENGILLPLLCAVVEFSFYPRNSRPRPIWLWHGLFVLLPLLVGLLAFLIAPARLLAGYGGRDFTPAERVLSQGRALCDYIGKILLPSPPRMGVFTDDFVASQGLLSPPTTLLAILALLAVTVLTWNLRKRAPAVLFGWMFFLIAHALEASPISLELYFEHRNYLPSVGLLAAAVTLAMLMGTRLQGLGIRSSRIGSVLLVGSMLVLTIGTHGRARVWRNVETIAESSLVSHPTSMRANTYVLAAAMDRGDRERATRAVSALLGSSLPRNRSMGRLFKLYADCVMTGSSDPEDLEAFIVQTPMPLTPVEAQPFDTLYQLVREKPCPPLTDKMLGTGLARLADRSVVEARQSKHIRMRYQAASFLVRAGEWELALPQAQLAWTPTAPAPVAAPLVLSYLGLNDKKAAESVWQEAQLRLDRGNQDEVALMQWLRRTIDGVAASEKATDGLDPSYKPASN